MASPQCWGREYASLSAACGPDQSASNKEIMESRAVKSNEQRAFFFVRFLRIPWHYISSLVSAARPVQRTLGRVHGYNLAVVHRRGWGDLGRAGLLQGP